ncbi:type 4a pilus biogenesis protein PilO [Candidatus Palauibacter sp.]|uniref:type 4a pilus biogenesis protein PilO n=1 Tax=Candidatus Palauibacter sp. TaxID=3101350 RepID=UPI003B5BF05F
MTLLPRDPRDQTRLLCLIFLLGFGAAFHLYVWTPRRIELAELEQHIEQAQRANTLAETRAGDLDSVRDDLELGERRFALLQRLVPETGEVAAIYEAIAAETQSLGLELVHVVPSDPMPDSAGYFLRQHWAMQVEGGYHRVGQFLARVAAFTRIVRPEVEEIVPARITNSGRQLVHVRFTLETFVLPPAGGIPLERG